LPGGNGEQAVAAHSAKAFLATGWSLLRMHRICAGVAAD
jgi:hypothetical protein